MALFTCPECQVTISDKAAACVGCGAPVRTPVANAMPVVTVRPPKTLLWYWWLWGPVGVVFAFLLFGAMIPKNVADANAFARSCRELARGDPVVQLECDRGEAKIRYSEPAYGRAKRGVQSGDYCKAAGTGCRRDRGEPA